MIVMSGSAETVSDQNCLFHQMSFFLLHSPIRIEAFRAFRILWLQRKGLELCLPLPKCHMFWNILVLIWLSNKRMFSGKRTPLPPTFVHTGCWGDGELPIPGWGPGLSFQSSGRQSLQDPAGSADCRTDLGYSALCWSSILSPGQVGAPQASPFCSDSKSYQTSVCSVGIYSTTGGP